MTKKKLIWITGGMASGKSTLRSQLLDLLKKYDGKLIKEPGLEYTDYGNVAAVGDCTKKNQCNGLDSSFGRLKKEGALATTEFCIKNYNITILEGAQTSAQWVLPLCEMCLKHNCRFYLVHLDLRYWENYQRLRTRLLASGKTEKDISDDKLESIRGKNNQARLIDEKCTLTGFVKVIKLNTEDMSTEDKLYNVINGTKLKI